MIPLSIATRRRPSLAGLLVLVVAVYGCGDGATAVELASATISPPAGLAVGIGGTVRFSVTTVDVDGNRTIAADATWSVEDPTVAVVDPTGFATGVAVGTTRVFAEVGSITAVADIEVYVPDAVTDYVPGTSYFGRNDYVEYIPGELPVVLSASHGGALTPDEIPNRSFGVTGSDRNTAQLTHAIRDAFIDRTGFAPHIIVSHLHRVKLDPNREIVEAAQGSAFAERAWEEFQAFIGVARVRVAEDFGGGMYFDLHGHGHPKNRLELGYLLSSDRLNQTDASLNSLAIVQMSSVRELGRTRPDTFADLLRGATSLGGLLESHGVPVVPSPGDPRPLSDPYFTGGYNTRRHGSMADTELVSGIQIEHHFPGLRDTPTNRDAYAALLADAVEAYLLGHFGFFAPTP